jgi:DNA mismatch repair protein MutS
VSATVPLGAGDAAAGGSGSGPAGAAASTPLMQQYQEIKARHPGAILFFRMGDFYEMFYEDAAVASRVLGLTLTARNNGGAAEVPLAGVPARACAEYVRRLVSRGYRVAICEQIEDPRQAKGVVRRAVVETVTPGAAFADELLEAARNNYLCAVAVDGARLALAAVDVSTGELRLATAPLGDADALVARYAPREVLVAADGGEGALAAGALPAALAATALADALVTPRARWEFDPALAAEELGRLFEVRSLDGLGLVPDDAPAVGAAGALVRYLRELQPAGVPHLARPVVERAGAAMPLDEMTRRNLELVESLRPGADGEQAGTLVSVLDRTATPMGARLLRRWLLAPLVDRPAIDARLDAVAALAATRSPAPRCATRSTGCATWSGWRPRRPRRGRRRASCACSATRSRASPAVRAALERAAGPSAAGRLGVLLGAWDDCGELADEIAATLVARPPLQVGEEPTVAPGVDADLDEARALRDGGRDAIARIQQEERARTGIASLKVGYNRVFGYFIEVSNAHRAAVPGDYQRRQTLTGGERYVTPALKAYEERVLTAAEQARCASG